MSGTTPDKINDIKNSSDRYLCFSLGEENFSIPLLSVKEVIGVPEFTKIPYVPSYFCGIMNLRGKVISVIDLRKKLNITPKGTEENSVIVCTLEQLTMGILVDSVDMVLNIPKENILSKPDVQTTIKIDFIDGFYNHKETLYAFLNLAKALSVEDILAIQKTHQETKG